MTGAQAFPLATVAGSGGKAIELNSSLFGAKAFSRYRAHCKRGRLRSSPLRAPVILRLSHSPPGFREKMLLQKARFRLDRSARNEYF